MSSFETDFNLDYTSEAYASSDSHLQYSPMLSRVYIAELMQMVGHSEFFFLDMKGYLLCSYPNLMVCH